MKTNSLLAITAVVGHTLLASSYTAKTWEQTSAPITNWTSIACSADGGRLVAVVEGGGIYTSPDSGGAWAFTGAPITNWWAVASSADGTRLFAAANGGVIYCSSDSGVTWSPTSAAVTNWTAVACSADGTKALAVAGGSLKPLTYFGQPGPIYTSSDSGTTWSVSSAPIGRWIAVTASADGNALMAVAPFSICVSKDSGATWVETNVLGYTTSIACSADGRRVVLGCEDPFHMPYGGSVLVSTNFGAVWSQSTLYTEGRGSVASSADGKRLLAAGGPRRGAPAPGMIFTSLDGGDSWSTNSAPPTNWTAVASSADGSKLAAVVGGGGIYVAQFTVAPLLNIRASGTHLVLSWTVPSLSFALQENSDLTMTNWADVPSTSELNFTNLQHQLTLAMPAGNRFYRLKSP